MRPTEKMIEKYYMKAFDTAIALIEQRARKILEHHPELKEFIMAMGTYCWTDSKGEIIMEDEDKKFSSIDKIIEDWDEYLHLTGQPMRFTADGPKITEWGVKYPINKEVKS